MAHLWGGVLREYADRLGVTDASTVVTLGEGGTPAAARTRAVASHRRRRLGEVRGHEPDGLLQGSRHDRGPLARRRARREGRHLRLDRQHLGLGRGYAAHAGITAAVLVPEGKIAMGKLSQAVAHNGRLIQIRGNFDDCLEIARELADHYPCTWSTR